ncbi:hypothetical protein NE865_07599 [Phthorimaea operculella]|nr:hypothetical protein NE865_07599 [Phthorimaea operculella]
MNAILKHLGICVFLLYVFQPFVLADDDEVDCVDISMEELKICKDWEHVPTEFDVKLTMDEHHQGTFNGKIIVKEPISEGVEITLMVMLMTPNGDELIYTTAGDLCQSLGDDMGMWGPIVEALNTTCPIHVGRYKLEDIKINFQALKPLMIEDYIGQYKIPMSIELAVKKFMCVLLVAEIYEETRLLSKCPNPQ